jgi:hypothetical protein
MSDRQKLFEFGEQDLTPVRKTAPRSPSSVLFHKESFELLGRELPHVSKVESDLPASVAQWYDLSDGLSLLREYSNSDCPVAPHEFQYEASGKRTLASFLHENQGVCSWAFDVKGGDDPAVYIIVDSPSGRWHRCCSSFSTFVYTRLFDFRFWCHPTKSAMEIGPPLTAATLRTLRRSCRQHPSTKSWPGDAQNRFSEDDRRFTLCKSEGQTDWYLSATTGESLNLALEKYRQLVSQGSARIDWPT